MTIVVLELLLHRTNEEKLGVADGVCVCVYTEWWVYLFYFFRIGHSVVSVGEREIFEILFLIKLYKWNWPTCFYVQALFYGRNKERPNKNNNNKKNLFSGKLTWENFVITHILFIKLSNKSGTWIF